MSTDLSRAGVLAAYLQALSMVQSIDDIYVRREIRKVIDELNKELKIEIK